MAVQVVGTTSASGSSSSLAISPPFGVNAGDLMLLGASFDDIDGSNAAITPPAGFSSVPNSPVSFHLNNQSILGLFYKAASAVETNPYNLAFIGSGTGFSTKAVCRVLRNVNTLPGSSAGATDGIAWNSWLDAPSVTPNLPNTLLVCLWGVAEGASVRSWPSGMDNKLKVDGSGSAELMIAQQNLSAAGPTGIRTLRIWSNNPWASVSVIINVDTARVFPLWENF